MPAHRSRGAGALRGLNGAAPPQTGSSPGCAAAGSPGSCDLHDAGPSRGCSAAGSCPLLHRRSWCSRCQPRSRCLQRCRSCWNDRSRTESATESSGGPWWGGAAGRWWMLAMRLEKVAVLLSSCLLSIGDGRMLPASSDAFKCFFFYRHNEVRYLEAAGSALVLRTNTIRITSTLNLSVIYGNM